MNITYSNYDVYNHVKLIGEGRRPELGEARYYAGTARRRGHPRCFTVAQWKEALMSTLR